MSIFSGGLPSFNQMLGNFSGAPQKFPVQKVVGSVMVLKPAQGGVDPFYFFDLEVPEALPLGGRQVSVRHEFPGGDLGYDMFGDQTRELTWTGLFYSLDARTLPAGAAKSSQPAMSAVARAQALDAFRISQQICTLYFSSLKFKVIVREFEYDVHHSNEVSYTLRLGVLEDNTQDALPNSLRFTSANIKPSVNLLNQYANYVNGINKAMKNFISLGDVVVGNLKQIAKDPSQIIFAGAPLIPGAGQTLQLIQTMQTAHTTLNNWLGISHPQMLLDMEAAKPYETLDNNALQRLMKPTVQATYADISAIVEFALGTFLSFANSDPGLIASISSDGYNAKNALSNMLTTIDKMVAPITTPTIKTQNPDLYKLANQYYGDLTKWEVIADANGLNTPRPQGTYTLKIPLFHNQSTSNPTIGSSVGNA